MRVLKVDREGSASDRAAAETQLRTELQPGDILLALSNGEAGRNIARISGGEHSHAAVWSGSAVIEATFPAVRERSLSAFLEGRVHVDVYRFSAADEQQRCQIAEKAKSYLGRRYGEVDLALAIAIGTITAWLQTDVRPLRQQVEWLRVNTLHGAGRARAEIARPWPEDPERGSAVPNRLRAVLERLRRVCFGALGDHLTCVDLVVRASLDAGLPLKIKLNPRGKLDVAGLRACVRELLAAREKGEQEAQPRAEHGSSSASLHPSLEAAAATEQDRAALEASLDWLEALALELDAHSTAPGPGHEISVEEAERLIFTAGGDWPGGLVTPVQLAHSAELEEVMRVSFAPFTASDESAASPTPFAGERTTFGLPRK